MSVECDRQKGFVPARRNAVAFWNISMCEDRVDAAEGGGLAAALTPPPQAAGVPV